MSSIESEFFTHPDFQHIKNYEKIISNPEFYDLYEIHKEGHEKWGQSYLTLEQEYYILDAYYNCNVTPKISAEVLEKELGISAETIRKVIRRFGEIRKLNEALKLYTVNEDYFEIIDTPEKAYWLGLLYADGHVTKELDRVIISLKEEDGCLIEQFAEDIEYTGVIETTRNQPNPKAQQFPQTSVRINSRKMAKDLTKWGCSPSKTKDLSFPHWMEEWLRPHFARGFIDGDGWVSITRRKNSELLTVGWCGTWAMTFETAMFFWNFTEYRNLSTYDQGIIYINKTTGKFAIQIGDLIYKDATRKLERKYNNYIYIKNNLKKKGEI